MPPTTPVNKQPGPFGREQTRRLVFGALAAALVWTSPLQAGSDKEPDRSEPRTPSSTVEIDPGGVPSHPPAVLVKAETTGPQKTEQPLTPSTGSDEATRIEAPVNSGEGESNRRRGRMDASDEMAVLDHILAMPPDQLARVRRAIEQIEGMEPKEREAIRARLRDFRQISPEERHKMREKWKELSPEERREHVQQMRERHWENVFKTDGAEEKPKESASP
jgi:hypothetical protein